MACSTSITVGGMRTSLGYEFLAVALVPTIFVEALRPSVRALSNDTKWPGLALVAAAQLAAGLGALGKSYFSSSRLHLS